MKLKNILSLTVACGAALMMTVAANAATEVKVSGASVDEYGAVVPVVVNTTDGELMDNVEAYSMELQYDNSRWEYAGINDDATYSFRGQTNPKGSLTVNNTDEMTNNDGKVRVEYACGGGNGFPEPDENGQIALFTVYLNPIGSNSGDSISDNEFTVGVTRVTDFDYDTQNSNPYLGENMKSFFTFDVTGDLDGNEVVALAASTDNGVTKQPLEYYTTTDWTDGMDYADATTTFLVAVDNTQGATDVTDITIYGELEDGSYIPLSSLNQSDFLVQTFSRE